MKDASLDDADSLLPPAVIAREIAEDLEAALAELAAVADALAEADEPAVRAATATSTAEPAGRVVTPGRDCTLVGGAPPGPFAVRDLAERRRRPRSTAGRRERGRRSLVRKAASMPRVRLRCQLPGLGAEKADARGRRGGAHAASKVCRPLCGC